MSTLLPAATLPTMGDGAFCAEDGTCSWVLDDAGTDAAPPTDPDHIDLDPEGMNA